MKIIVFNSTNIIPDGQNNKLVYNFPNSVTFQNSYVSVTSVSLYYSWFNITAAQQNNVFSYNWTVDTKTTTYIITIPDGLYEVSTLNKLLQYEMIANGTYLISENENQNVYYAEFSVNPTRYAVQLNTFQVPTSLPTNYLAPNNFVGFPKQTFNPVVDFSISQIYKILGFTSSFKSSSNTDDTYIPPVNQTLISKNSAGTISYLSTSAPNLQPNSTVLISMSNIDNNLAQPNSILYSVVPSVGIGEIIKDAPPQLVWTKLIDGTYNQFRLTLLGGSNLQPLLINDPNMTIMLAVGDSSVVSMVK